MLSRYRQTLVTLATIIGFTQKFVKRDLSIKQPITGMTRSKTKKIKKELVLHKKDFLTLKACRFFYE